MKIAVIGAGISGLGTSVILGQKHEVHLFESEQRLGGHAHTSQVEVRENDGSINKINVDTGFLVYNDLTYPHLKSLFNHYNVETVNSDMSLSIHVPHHNIEWAGDNLNTVFAQRKNLINPRFYKMIFDILNFHKNAEKYLFLARQKKWTLGEMLDELKYSQELAEWYVLPMVAAIWSTSEKNMKAFPAETFLTFFLNHKLLQVNDRPQWKTVLGGSKKYVETLEKHIFKVYKNEPVKMVHTEGEQHRVVTDHQDLKFDAVVFATHAPTTLNLYKNRPEQVYNVLKNFKTTRNKAVLHHDSHFMPKSKKCWASWNVFGLLGSQNESQVSLSYYLNRLQPLSTQREMILTLNPQSQPRDSIFEHNYDHPEFNQAAIDAQKKIQEIQGLNHVYYAGAWTRYGFHEDGLLSAVNVAKHLEIDVPWKMI